MRMFHFPTHMRSSVGFDRIFDLLDSASRLDFSDSWPPYDIVKIGEDRYQVALAVPGLSQSELSVTHENGYLVIRGQAQTAGPDGEYLHRGLAHRGFEQRFELADHVRVTEARLADGVLCINLVRQVPDHLKPRQIPIQTSALPRWTTDKRLPTANANGGTETRHWWSRLRRRAA